MVAATAGLKLCPFLHANKVECAKAVWLWSFNYNLCLEFFDLAGNPVSDHMWQNYRCYKNHAYLRCFSFRIFFVLAHLFLSKTCYLQEFSNLTVLKCLTVFFIPNIFTSLFFSYKSSIWITAISATGFTTILLLSNFQ